MTDAATTMIAVCTGLTPLVAAAGLAAARYLRARGATAKTARELQRAQAEVPPPAVADDLESLARRVTEVERAVRRSREAETKLRQVLERLTECDAANARNHEDVARLRKAVAELARDLLEAQLELNQTLAKFRVSYGHHEEGPPRSRKR